MDTSYLERRWIPRSQKIRSHSEKQSWHDCKSIVEAAEGNAEGGINPKKSEQGRGNVRIDIARRRCSLHTPSLLKIWTETSRRAKGRFIKPSSEP